MTRKEDREPGFPTARWADNLRFNLGYVLPSILQGPFLRKPGWVKLLSRIQAGFLSSGLGPRLRAQYGRCGVRMRFLLTPSIVLLDGEPIEHVLRNSPSTFGPPPAKCKGMSHFQPGAATISQGDEWRERRALNEAALFPGRPHPLLPAVHAIVREETTALIARRELVFADFAALFERITLRSIFGRAGEAEASIAAMLRRLMRRANNPLRRPQETLLREFRERLGQAIEGAEAKSLAALARAHPAAQSLELSAQVTHWLFAMNDTLAENTVRAAGVIHGLRATWTRARRETESVNLADPEGVGSLRFVEACLEEAMRLWPSTPFLLREVKHEETLCGSAVRPREQVVIPTVLQGVDPAVIPRATEWHPDRWTADSAPAMTLHFGGGAQACPGADLARFIGTWVLAGLVAGREYETAHPRLGGPHLLPRVYDPFSVRLVERRAVL